MLGASRHPRHQPCFCPHPLPPQVLLLDFLGASNPAGLPLVARWRISVCKLLFPRLFVLWVLCVYAVFGDALSSGHEVHARLDVHADHARLFPVADAGEHLFGLVSAASHARLPPEIRVSTLFELLMYEALSYSCMRP